MEMQKSDRFRLLSELTFEGIFFHRDAICVEVNQAYCNMTGYTREELVGKNLVDMMVLDESKPLLYENLQTEYAKPYRIKVRRKDNSTAMVEIESKIFELDGEKLRVTAVRDITERLKAEKALVESEEKYRAAFKTSPDSVNINRLDGVYVDINDGFTKLTGYSREDVIGKSSLEINIWAIPEDRNKLVSALKAKGFMENLETVFRLKDGTLKTGLMSASIILINNEPHILSITRDISYRKTIEDELIKAKEKAENSETLLKKQNEELQRINNELLIAKDKAEESDRLKSAFLANLSHEIRTPMNGLMGFIDLLLQDDVTDDKRTTYSNIIKDSCQLTLNIINDILDISKLETHQCSVNLKEVYLNDFMTEIYLHFTEKAKEKELEFVLDKMPTNNVNCIITDEQKLKQILNNLISNSIKFTKEGIIQLGYSFSGDSFITFHVKDTGIGIPKEYHESIFDRFRQVDSTNERRYGGTGLGLAIAKGFIELLGGKIWCESEVNVGSTFYFLLPFKKADKENKTSQPAKQPPVEKHETKTILVAEDEEINFLYIEELLMRIDNVSIIHVTNGLDAVGKVKNNNNIDLVLMDIKMPLMNGYDATKQIKKLRPGLPVIAQTAYAMPDDEILAKNAGCDAYISKPVLKDNFLRVVNRFLLT